MKVLITGANGLLGQHLTQLLLSKGYTVIATGKGEARLHLEGWGDRYVYQPLDITDAIDVQQVLGTIRPEVVVHAAAITQVDDCELHPEQCERVNVTGTSQVLVDAEVHCQHFIYVSTDFVFDGEQGNYKEEDDLKPISYYGFTKMQAEAITETSTIPWAIVRTCLVYGNILEGTRSNIITWVKNNLEQGKPIKVVSDQWRTPTYVEDLARGIALIIDQKATGIYHISGKDLLTPYDIALQTADHFGLDKNLITKVDASTFQQPGRRPLRTGFMIDKARKELGFEPISFQEGIRKMFAQ